jgi:hypothetical protein
MATGEAGTGRPELDEQAGQAAKARWWCSRCGQPARLEGPDDIPRTLRKAVHDFTSQEKGPDGHLVLPVDEEPPLWAAVRRLRAEVGAEVDITARFGVLRADFPGRPRSVPVITQTEGEMRGRLRRPMIAYGLTPPRLACEPEEAR